MNRFLTHDGRQPIWLDDIDFQQNSVVDEFLKFLEGIIPGCENEVIILSGCEKTVSAEGLVTISAGIISYYGELYKTPQATFTSDLDFRVRVYTEYDPAGDRSIVDTGEEVSCYELRKAAISTPQSIQGKPDSRPRLADCGRLEDILRDRISEEVIAGGATVVNGNTPVYYRLTRIRSSYRLVFQFYGLYPDSDISISDNRAIADIFAPYSAWFRENRDFRAGRTYAAVGYYGSINGVGEVDGALAARVECRLPNGYVTGTPATINVRLSGEVLTKAREAGGGLSGGFSVELVNRDIL